mgnify:CR=1 FL=1
MKTIKLNSFSILSYRVMNFLAKTKKLNSKETLDYGEYQFAINIALNVLQRMDEKILKQLVKSDFLKEIK